MSTENETPLQAPDSMALRLELVARLKPDHAQQFTQYEFEEAQKVLRSLRKNREKLQRLGLEFTDLPPRGKR